MKGENLILVNEKYTKEYKKDGEFLYFLQIGEVKNGKRRIKIGTTNNMKRRMKEHQKYYGDNIYVLWCKKLKSKWTTLMKEDSNKENFKANNDWDYKRNDRFDIPADITELKLKIRKEYTVSFDCMCVEIE